jgi:hypothetical protein
MRIASIRVELLSNKIFPLSIWLRTIKCKWITLQHTCNCVCLDMNYFSPVIMSEYTVQHVNMPTWEAARKSLFESLHLYSKLHIEHSTDLCTNWHGFSNHKPDFVIKHHEMIRYTTRLIQFRMICIQPPLETWTTNQSQCWTLICMEGRSYMYINI